MKDEMEVKREKVSAARGKGEDESFLRKRGSGPGTSGKTSRRTPEWILYAASLPSILIYSPGLSEYIHVYIIYTFSFFFYLIILFNITRIMTSGCTWCEGYSTLTSLIERLINFKCVE